MYSHNFFQTSVFLVAMVILHPRRVLYYLFKYICLKVKLAVMQTGGKCVVFLSLLKVLPWYMLQFMSWFHFYWIFSCFAFITQALLPQQVQQILKAIFVCITNSWHFYWRFLWFIMWKVLLQKVKKTTKASGPLFKTIPLCSAAQLLGLDCSLQMVISTLTFSMNKHQLLWLLWQGSSLGVADEHVTICRMAESG